jgi:hypothetical protein
MQDAGTIPWIERLVGSPAVRSTYASLIAHVALLALLALLAADRTTPPRPPPVVIAMVDAAQDEDPGAGVELTATADAEAASSGDPAPDATAPPPTADEPLPAALHPEMPETIASQTADFAPPALADIAADLPATGGGVATRTASHAPARQADARADAYAGRRGGARAPGARARGGSAASEAAVERGLAWLARHQAADGSWRFDLSGCRCDGGCRDAGTVASTTAATGIALLPFLGAGHTHVEGEYREAVTRGIYYLMSRMRPTPRGGDLCEGTMYGQGVATLALAEALGMTRDDMLERYVGDGVRFIETAQDMHGGGWRYLPGQPGDITVTGWQLAALKSAALAGVAVPTPTIDAACRFLDRVQVRYGEAYGYQSAQAKPATSAVGLLCRLYTGWENEAAIDSGLGTLARPGPAPAAIYQNFYLSQALLQRSHPVWPKWNQRNRDQLVAAQAGFGHELGSWVFADPDTAPGGRLAHTALAVLTLEVYYRLLPIYTKDAVETEF